MHIAPQRALDCGPGLGGQQGLVVKAVSTHICSPGLIPGGEKEKRELVQLPDRVDFANVSINRGSLYQFTLLATKHSHKVSKCVDLLDLLGKLY